MSITITRLNFFRHHSDGSLFFDMYQTFVIKADGEWKEPVREIVVETDAPHGYSEALEYLVSFEIEADECVLEVSSTLSGILTESLSIIHVPFIMTDEIIRGIYFVLEKMDIDLTYALDLIAYGHYTQQN